MWVFLTKVFAFLIGGFQEFEQQYPELCEDALRPRDSPPSMCPSNKASPGIGDENCIQQASMTQVLPLLYLGNARDAQDVPLLQVRFLVWFLSYLSIYFLVVNPVDITYFEFK